MRYIVSIVLALSLLGGCSRNQVIPDDKLVDIFHDIFLANAYKQNMGVNVDTLQMYAPIFDKYGYTATDVEYTVGSFSKRKSARLTDVVDRAIKRIEEEHNRCAAEVEVLDNIEQTAVKHTRILIYEVNSINVRGKDDVDKLNFIIDAVGEGDYKVEFDYLIDSLDRNTIPYRSSIWFEQPGVRVVRQGNQTVARKVGETTATLSRNGAGSYVRTITSRSENNKKLAVNLLNWRGELQYEPLVQIRDLRITYVPTAEDAVDYYYRDLLNLRIFSDDFFDVYDKKDSSELYSTEE